MGRGPCIIPLARLPSALPGRVALHGRHQRLSQASQGPCRRQGFQIHPQPYSRNARSFRAPAVEIGIAKTGGCHQANGALTERTACTASVSPASRGGMNILGRLDAAAFDTPKPVTHRRAGRFSNRFPAQRHAFWRQDSPRVVRHGLSREVGQASACHARTKGFSLSYLRKSSTGRAEQY